MSLKPDIQVEVVSNSTSQAVAVVNSPRKATLKSGFGAQPRRAWIEFYDEQASLPFSLGDWLTVNVNETRSFRGKIRQIRLDNQGDLLTVYAEWAPSREFDQLVSTQLARVTATGALDALVKASGLSYVEDPAHESSFTHLEFESHPLLAAIDLLAKLAGNWRWDIGDDATLQFRPFGELPDRVVLLENDHYTIDLWQHDESEFHAVEINAGIVSGEELTAQVISQELAHPSMVERLYARPIVTDDAMHALLAAVEMQQSAPHFSHYVDLVGGGEAIEPGETLQFTFETPLPLLPSEQVFRVKQREIVYAHESLRTRLHLTSSFESSDGYYASLKTDRVIAANYRDGRVGAFQLDVSSLDSESHLDAA